MTDLQRAEDLFDEAEREFEAGKRAAHVQRDLEAQRHYQCASECRQQANLLLEQVIRPERRIAS